MISRAIVVYLASHWQSQKSPIKEANQTETNGNRTHGSLGIEHMEALANKVQNRYTAKTWSTDTLSTIECITQNVAILMVWIKIMNTHTAARCEN